MNLTQLEYFHAVCMYQSISEAAEHLHISQPSLSVAIKELEKEFGVLFFKRHYRGVKLTDAGEELYEMSRRLLKDFKNLEQRVHDMGNKRTVLRVGVPPMIGTLFLPRIYKEFMEKNKDVSLEIAEGGRKKLLGALQEDVLDLVFLPHVAPFDKELQATEVARFEVVCGVAMDSPLKAKKEISMPELEGEPLVLLNNSFFQTEEILKRFSGAGTTPKILLQTDQLSSLQSIIKSNAAAGFLFRELIADSNEIQAVPLSPPLFVTVSLVWKKDAYMSDNMERFRDFVKKSFRS